MKNKHICILHTGGTIGMIRSQHGYMPKAGYLETVLSSISDLNDEMSLPENATNSAKLNEIAEKQAVANEELEQLYELWEELSEE